MQRSTAAPIGVFDSGVGGLSILQALRTELPAENFIYVADSAHAPYGERDEGLVATRALLIATHLRQHLTAPVKALVVACNTATAAAIVQLRQAFPELPIIGVEPALKPALALSRTRRIGVMATRGTLNSAKFQTLLAGFASEATFVCQPCDGLAAAIECDARSEIEALCARYTGALGRFGAEPDAIDTLVLGCTHYPFASQTLQMLVGPEVQLLDNGAPVARQTRRLLNQLANARHAGQLRLAATGSGTALAQASQRWLGVHSEVQCLPI